METDAERKRRARNERIRRSPYRETFFCIIHVSIGILFIAVRQGAILVVDLSDRWKRYKDGRARGPQWRAANEERKAREKVYKKYTEHKLKPLPVLRKRPLTPPPTLERSKTSRHFNESVGQQKLFSRQLTSLLLELPAKIRLIIWEFALGGLEIALFRDNGHIIHILLDNTNTKEPGRLLPIIPAGLNIEGVDQAVVTRTELPEYLPSRKRTELSALLKTCHLM